MRDWFMIILTMFISTCCMIMIVGFDMIVIGFVGIITIFATIAYVADMITTYKQKKKDSE